MLVRTFMFYWTSVEFLQYSLWHASRINNLHFIWRVCVRFPQFRFTNSWRNILIYRKILPPRSGPLLVGFIINEGKLVIRRWKYADDQLSPLLRDASNDDWSAIAGYPLVYTLIIGRDQWGEIDCLKVSGSRVRNLKIEKCLDGWIASIKTIIEYWSVRSRYLFQFPIAK